jgi:hypothetical protein
MANWRKKEAGYMVISNKANDAQFFCEKFHNVDEMRELEQKYKWINANIEHYIGTFANNAEIESAMEAYKLKNGGNREFFNEPEVMEHYDDMGSEPHLTVSLETFLRNWNKAKAMSDIIYDMDELAEEGVVGTFPCFNKQAMVDAMAREELQQLYSKPMLYKMSEKVLFMIGVVFVNFTDKPINYV